MCQEDANLEQIKNAVITGASRRIGRAIVIQLAKAGWNIALHYKGSEQEARELAAAIEAMGRKSALIKADLEKPEEARKLISEASERLGTLTGLINNASVFEPDDIKSLNIESFSRHLNTNLLAPVLLTQAFAAQISNQKGNIVNLTDQRVINLRPDFQSYTLSKSALWTFTQTAAMELAPTIRVNAIAPGPTLPNSRQSETQFNRQRQAVPLQTGPSDAEIASGV
ncbi:MAG: SDR family oxidoreductase, partial [Sneathiellales bacterium]|nr:SDR family oxidoreductase [Sneathiellales bacterium]